MKMNTIPFGMIAVLTFGMVSCSQDEVTPQAPPPIVEKRKIPSPVLRSAEKSLQVKNFEKDLPMEWSIDDFIDFPEPAPFDQFKVDVSCTVKDQSATAHRELPLKTVKLGSMIPESLIFDLLKFGGGKCDFQFVATSPKNHRHSFKINGLKFSSNAQPGVVLKSWSDGQELKDNSMIFKDELQKIQAQFQRNNADLVKLICEDSIYPALWDAQSLRNLGDIDWKNSQQTKVSPTRTSTSQSWRVYVHSRNFDEVQVSKIFTIKEPIKDLIVEPSFSTGFYGDNVPSTNFEKTSLINGGPGFPMGYLTITNPSAYTQTIELPLTLPSTSYGIGNRTFQANEYCSRLEDGVVYLEGNTPENGYVPVPLAPGQTMSFRYLFKHNQKPLPYYAYSVKFSALPIRGNIENFYSKNTDFWVPESAVPITHMTDGLYRERMPVDCPKALN